MIYLHKGREHLISFSLGYYSPPPLYITNFLEYFSISISKMEKSWKVQQTLYIFKNKYDSAFLEALKMFTVWLRIQLISILVLNWSEHYKKLCMVLYYKGFSTNNKITRMTTSISSEAQKINKSRLNIKTAKNLLKGSPAVLDVCMLLNFLLELRKFYFPHSVTDLRTDIGKF